MEKCSFSQQEVEFIDHKITDKKLMIENSKVKAVLEWKPLIKVPELRSFLGLVKYYYCFIKGYLAKASPLTNVRYKY